MHAVARMKLFKRGPFPEVYNRWRPMASKGREVLEMFVTNQRIPTNTQSCRTTVALQDNDAFEEMLDMTLLWAARQVDESSLDFLHWRKRYADIKASFPHLQESTVEPWR